MRPLRIGLVAPLWIPVPPESYGGIERRVALLATQFDRSGHEVTVFASGDSKPDGRLVATYPKNLCAAMEEGSAYHYDYYINSLVAEALAEADRLDVLHFHLGAHSIPFSRVTTTPTVHTIPTALTRDDRWVLESYPHACATVLSAQQKSVLPRDVRQRIHVVHNGCDVGSRRLARGPKEYLVFLGRMGKHKGPLEAIHIAREAGRKIVLAGAPKTAEEWSYFRSTVEREIDGDRVVHVGEVDDRGKDELFDRAIALLFPIAWDEPFGNVMIEAMACGVPVLAFKHGSVPEVVDEGLTGYVGESPEELAGRVPEALALERQTIRERVRQRFSVERMADSYLAVYDRVGVRGVPTRPAESVRC